MDEDFGNLPADEAPAPMSAPPAKKSLFSKKITAVAPTTGDAVSFFSRAEQVYPQRLAEQERKRQKKQVRLERKRSSASVELKEFSPEADKRRRVSEQREGYSSDSNSVKLDEEDGARKRRSVPMIVGEVSLMIVGRESTHSSPGSRHSRDKAQGSPTSLSARYTNDLSVRKAETSNQKPPTKGYISLSDSDSEAESEVSKPPARRPTTQPAYDDSPQRPVRLKVVEVQDDLSEEEFPELVQRAREREREKALAKKNKSTAFGRQNHGGQDLEDDDFFETGTATEADPVIQIFISSEIEDSKPLRVMRKLSQQLKVVRKSWVDKQVFCKGDQKMKDSVFLTWQGNRLFDSTTASSLVDDPTKYSADGKGSGIHLEAWTPEAFEEYQKIQEAEQKKEEGGREDTADEEDEVVKIRLILKTRNSEFKLVVKPSTSVKKVIVAYRRAKDIPDEKEITLHFDGDLLEPDSKIEDTDLGDMDSVEVHIQ